MSEIVDITQERLGLYFVLHQVTPSSPFGREQLLSIPLYQSVDTLKKEFQRIEVIGHLSEDKIFLLTCNLSHYKDIRNSFRRCMNDISLSITELYEIKLWCILLEEIISLIEPKIEELDYMIFFPEEVLKILDPKSNRETTFFIDSSFSSEIDRIREVKRKIDKQIADAKASEIMELKRKKKYIIADEQEAERKACKELTKELSKYAQDMLNACEFLGCLDLLLCKNKMIKEQCAIIPTITDGNSIIFEDMFNIEVEEYVKEQGHCFVPVSINLDYGVALITGVNMGGKSVAIKTLGLNVMLAMCGWPVFAKRAELPLISEINYTGIDNYKQYKGLSSFGFEMYELVQMTRNLKDNALLLIDEPAKGTNPEEGAAIVKGFISFLTGKKSFSLIATHYDGVASVADKQYKTYGLHNTDQFEDELSNMTCFEPAIFQRYIDYGIYLCEGNEEVPHEAIRICQLLGLAPEIITAIVGYLK